MIQIINTKTIRYFSLLSICFILFSCQEHQKEYVIEQDEMIDILVDIHTVDGMLSVQTFPYEKEALRAENLYKNILEKRGVTRQKFDSALTQYTKDRELYLKMYDVVIEKLKTRESAILVQGNKGEQQENKSALFSYTFFSNFDSKKTIDASKVKAITDEKSFSGKYSYKSQKEKTSQSYTTIIQKPIQGLEISLETYICWSKTPQFFPQIIFLLEDKQGKTLLKREYNSSQLRNVSSDWKMLKAKYKMNLSKLEKDVKLSVYFWNKNAEPFFIDDYSLKIKEIQ